MKDIHVHGIRSLEKVLDVLYLQPQWLKQNPYAHLGLSLKLFGATNNFFHLPVHFNYISI